MDWKTWISGSILPFFRGITLFSSASLFPQQNGNIQNGVGARPEVKMGVGCDAPATNERLICWKGDFYFSDDIEWGKFRSHAVPQLPGSVAKTKQITCKCLNSPFLRELVLCSQRYSTQYANDFLPSSRFLGFSQT